MSRALRWWLECETWNTHDTGTSRRCYRQWFNTEGEAQENFPRIRANLQRDFGSRFIELRIVRK